MFGSPSEVMSLAEVYLGMTPCQTDTANMKKVSDLLEAQAPFVKVYNSDGIIDRQGSGETWIHEVWNGDSARARANNPDIKFIFPKEGVGRLDGQYRRADQRQGPGEREEVRRIHAEAGEQRPVLELHPLRQRHHGRRSRPTIRP